MVGLYTKWMTELQVRGTQPPVVEPGMSKIGAILSKEERRTILVSDPRTHGASEGE